MSDEGERTCPLCAEEMDLTDQQLKPCKCGYEICVWCWHHIIDMAEKGDTEGRCPACRSPYDKERIVGMASSCERVVAEINAEKKNKSQKAKPKTSAEARKHLSSVRVIQRNLAYIIGLPCSLADESMLERKEYFGQYGKVLKVSVSRPASGAQQASTCNTFSVYITYAKEEEAVRCIQAVHNFVLEGKPLRACFGTTKYCHAWLRNMTCSNPDCLYLHDIGSQEDSFTKDEIISAYTRSRVPQIALNNLQKRSGNVLPPPAEDFCPIATVSSGKPAVKSSSYNCSIQTKVSASLNCVSTGRSNVLPAAASWGLRGTNSRPPIISTTPFQGSVRPKSESISSSTVTNLKHVSAWHDDVVSTSKMPEESHGMHSVVRPRPSESLKQYPGREFSTTASNMSDEVPPTIHISAWDDVVTTDEAIGESHVGDLNGRSKPSEISKPYTSTDSRTTVSQLLTDIAHAKESSAWNDDVVTTSKPAEGNHAMQLNYRSRSSDTSKSCLDEDLQVAVSDLSTEVVLDASHLLGTSSSRTSGPLVSELKDRELIVPGNNEIPANSKLPEELGDQLVGGICTKIAYCSTVNNGNIQGLCSGISSLGLDGHSGASHLTTDEYYNLGSHHDLTGLIRNPPVGLHQLYPASVSLPPAGASVISEDSQVYGDLSSGSRWNSATRKQAPLPRGMSGILAFDDNQREKVSDAFPQSSYMPRLSESLNVSNGSSRPPCSNDVGSTCHSVNRDPGTVNAQFSEALHPFSISDPVLRNEYRESHFCSASELGNIFDSRDIVHKEDRKHIGRPNGISNVVKGGNVDMGESSIISNILSMDFDPWDDSASPNNFAKLLTGIDKQDGSLKFSGSWKSQSSNQSRFSFARQENHVNFSEPFSEIGQVQKQYSSQDVLGDGLRNGSTVGSFEDLSGFSYSNGSFVPSDNNSAVSRAKISAPPGFSAPNRAPPPGFSCQDRLDQAYDTTHSENYLLGSPLMRNQYPAPLIASNDDVELIDPAILAVGKGSLPPRINRSGLGLTPRQFHESESDSRLQMLMQQSISGHQNLRIPDYAGDRYLPLNDAYIPSRLVAQNQNSYSPFSQVSFQQSRNSLVSNSQFDGWNNIPGANDISMAEILRNERHGINKYFPGNEDLQFNIPGNLYNRAFRIISCFPGCACDFTGFAVGQTCSIDSPECWSMGYSSSAWLLKFSWLAFFCRF